MRNHISAVDQTNKSAILADRKNVHLGSIERHQLMNERDAAIRAHGHLH